MWIPLVNFINIYAWLVSIKEITPTQKKWTYILGFGSVIFCALTQLGITICLPQIADYSSKALMYLIPLALDWGIIRLQEQT